MRFISITIPQLTVFIAILLILRVFFHFYEKELTLRGRTPVFSEKVRAGIKEWADSIIIAGISAIIIIQFIVQPFYIPSESMYPTLKKWDFILVNKFIYRFTEPKYGDIIVFNPPPDAHAGDKEYIKRLIGEPGDTIEVKDGALFKNSKKLDEAYVKYPDISNFSGVKIPPGSCFAMGDNRANSSDSRVWGPLPRKNIVGKAFIIIWPPGRISILR